MRRELAIFDLPAFLDAVRDGTIVDVGPGTFEGRAVLRYERTIGADTTTWYLDPATSWPVATWMRTRGVEGDPALGLERYEVFETVPADDELLELDVPAGTPRELDLPPEWAPLHEGDPAPAAIRQAFADTATLGDLAPERLPVPERAVVARVIELGPQSQYVLLTAPVEHGGLPCYVLQEQDREGEWHSPVAHCPGGSTGYGYPSLNPSRDGRWWTVAGVLPPEIERVALQVGTRRVPLATRDRIVADAVPAGAADEPVWLVITLGGGTPQRVGPKAGTTLAQFGLRPP